MTNEIELKLLIDAADVPRLRRHPALRARRMDRARRSRLLSVYYDTPDQRLRRAGVALRVRKKGRGFVQCVKSDRSGIGGVIVRRESEAPVRSIEPSLAAIPDDDLRRAIVELAPDGLQPLFSTDMMRTSNHLRVGDGGVARLDVDVGEVRANGEHEDLCEVELELAKGHPAGLFEIARELHSKIPLRVSTISKAARGYRLAGGERPEPHKFGGLQLDRSDTVEIALRKTVQRALDQVLANEAAVIHSDHPEGVHQMRVGIRRCRSALSLFRDVLPGEQRQGLNAALRWLAGELARIRDLDVQVAEIVRPVALGLSDERGLQLLLERLGTERLAARDAARNAVRSERFTDVVLDVSEWLAHASWRDQPLTPESALIFRPVTEHARQILDRQFRRVRRKAKRFAELSIDQRHRLRIDVKKLRYAMDFFGALFPQKPVKRFAKRLAKLQDALGYLNDVAVAQNLVDHIADLGTPADAHELRRAGGIVIGWHGHALAAIETSLARSLEDLAAAKPFWGPV